jgi:hypothetical protein
VVAPRHRSASNRRRAPRPPPKTPQSRNSRSAPPRRGMVVAPLVRRQVALVELDRLDRKRSGPAGLVVERVRERRLGVLLAEEQVDRLRVSKLDEGIRTRGSETIAVRRAWLSSRWPSPQRHQTMTSPGSAQRTSARK